MEKSLNYKEIMLLCILLFYSFLLSAMQKTTPRDNIIDISKLLNTPDPTLNIESAEDSNSSESEVLLKKAIAKYFTDNHERIYKILEPQLIQKIEIITKINQNQRSSQEIDKELEEIIKSTVTDILTELHVEVQNKAEEATKLNNQVNTANRNTKLATATNAVTALLCTIVVLLMHFLKG